VDYYGVARHLKDEIPELRDQHHRVVAVFTSRGIADLADIEGCV
jgi:type I restriction enzyme, R subunit